jgi:Leucine-rich repeat (LRR) protein
MPVHGNQIDDLTGIEYALYLDVLDIRNNRISNITPLSGLTLLKILNLDGEKNAIDSGQIENIAPLSGLVNLERLRMNYNKISDISPLSGLKKLWELELLANQISDISSLAGLKSLTHLVLDENQITDVSPLVGLTSLSFLALGRNQISDISALSGMNLMTRLFLSDNQMIDELSALSSMTDLVELNLNNNQIDDISPLLEITELTRLELRENQIEDISALSGMDQLTRLDLRNNQISDISALSGMTLLTNLFLADNQIDDLSALSGMTLLTELALSNNQINDISALSGMILMTNLSIHGNQISNISALSGMTLLTDLSLSGNQISDISPLQNLKNLNVLLLKDNPLNGESHTIWIPIILYNNPGIDLQYDVYSQDSLQMWFEAEGGDISSPMEITNDATAFGGQFIQVSLGNSTSEPPIDGHAEYGFYVPGGTYMVWGRINALSGDDDSFWARIEGATTNTNNHPSGWIKWTGITHGTDWFWNPIRSNDDGNTAVQFTLAEGSYTLEIAYREDGTKLDHLLITDYLNLSADDISEITPTGSYTEVAPVDSQTGGTPVVLTFDDVTESGETSLTTSSTGSPTPAGFQLGNPATYYDISTTANYSGLIDVRVSYSGVTFPGPAEDLQLLHYEDGAWVDRTILIDTENEMIYGSVDSLSPFAIMVLVDNEPPVFESLTATPNILWPPNHKMIAITVDWTVSDVDPDPKIELKSIVMNEGDETNAYDPAFDNTLGDGQTTGDIQVDEAGVIYLRAERSGTGMGRIYTLTYEATDAAGNVGTASVTVTVPHEAP